MVRVWVDDWQMACCGSAFSVGARVLWTMWPEVDAEWLGDALGAELARTVQYAEDHHYGAGAVPVQISATVAAIETVHCDFAPRGGDGAMWPVPGSDRRESVEYAPRWVPDQEPRRFVGWVVDLDHDYLVPVDPDAPPPGHRAGA